MIDRVTERPSPPVLRDAETIVTPRIEPTSAGGYRLKWRKDRGVSAVGVGQDFVTRGAAEEWAEFRTEGREITWREKAA